MREDEGIPSGSVPCPSGRQSPYRFIGYLLKGRSLDHGIFHSKEDLEEPLEATKATDRVTELQRAMRLLHDSSRFPLGGIGRPRC